MQSEDTEIHHALCALHLHRRYASEIAQEALTHGGFAPLAGHPTLGPMLAGASRMAEQTLEECVRRAISVVLLTSSRYPVLLRASAAPPLALFVRTESSSELFSEKSVAVVGARTASVDACCTASDFGRAFAEAGWCVVSGLALGVDGAAHRGALDCADDGRTLAVLAHGLDMVYPSSHEALADRILERGGVLLSEYPPGTAPFKHHFLERNRIVAGLARGVVVVQAGARSGSLVTARFAADAGRDVFVVNAGEAVDSRFEGSERLVADGARCVDGPDEVLAEYSALGSHATDLVTIPLRELSSAGVVTSGLLARLEIEGKLTRLPGGLVRMSRSMLSDLIASARARLGDIDLG